MKVSALAAMWGCVAFAIFCLGFAVNGFLAISSITDNAERDASLGYAWFWSFLAVIAVVFGVLSWMIKEGRFGDPEQM